MAINLQDSTPLYVQIAEDIKNAILTGKLKVGDKLGSHHELSAQYEVSLITIKKALSTLNDEGYLYSRVGKGTFVARQAANLNLKKHRSIGIVLEDLQSPFFSLITEMIENEAYEKGYNILISNTSGHRKKEENQIKHFRKIGVSGLIIASMSHEFRANESLRKLHNDNYPYVSISYVHDEEIHFVGSDHAYGAQIATEYLADLGYHQIGYINGEKGNLLGNLRLEGYKRGLVKCNIAYDPQLTFHLKWKGEWKDYESGYDLGSEFDQLNKKPDAMFCYNDLCALGFEQSLLDKGYNIPGDVAIIGFDDIERSRYAPVPLTTIHQPTSEIGKKAIGSLINQIEGLPTDDRIILPPKLVIRDSCGGKKRKASQREKTLTNLS